jgi:hypothetical protein
VRDGFEALYDAEAILRKERKERSEIRNGRGHPDFVAVNFGSCRE